MRKKKYFLFVLFLFSFVNFTINPQKTLEASEAKQKDSSPDIAPPPLSLQTPSPFFNQAWAIYNYGSYGPNDNFTAGKVVNFDNDNNGWIVTLTTHGPNFEIRVVNALTGISRPGFPVNIFNSGYSTHVSVPAIGDVTGDGKPDIIFATDDYGNGVFVYNDRGQRVTHIASGHSFRNFDPVVADVDGDNISEIILHSGVDPAFLDIQKVDLASVPNTPNTGLKIFRSMPGFPKLDVFPGGDIAVTSDPQNPQRKIIIDTACALTNPSLPIPGGPVVTETVCAIDPLTARVLWN